MRSTFDTTIVPSFTLWVDNLLGSQGQAFINNSGQLYPATDKRVGDYFIYASPFRSWVSDSSVSGAQIPSGVYNNGTFIPRSSGLIIDFQNGRILSKQQYSNLTASYSFKELSVKYTSESEENILFNNTLKLQAQYNNGPVTGINSATLTIPIVLIKYEPGTDEAFAFGNELKNTQNSFRCIIISDDEALLDGAMGILRDQTERIVALADPGQLPYTYYGDLKSGYYNYNDIINNKIGYFYIKSVGTQKFSEEVNVMISQNLWAGFADFEIETYRSRNGINGI